MSILRLLTLLLTSLAAVVSADPTITGCIDANGVPEWVITVPGGAYSYTKLTVYSEAGDTFKWRDSPVEINAAAVTITDNGDSSELNTAIQGFSNSNTAVITVHAASGASGDSFDATIDLILGFASGPSKAFMLEAVAAGSCGDSGTSSSASEISSSANTEVPASSTEPVTTQVTSSEPESTPVTFTTPETTFVPTTEAETAPITSTEPGSTSAALTTPSGNAATASSADGPTMTGYIGSDGNPAFIINVPGSVGAYDEFEIFCSTTNELSYNVPFSFINGDTEGQTSATGGGISVDTKGSNVDGTKGLTISITTSFQGPSNDWGLADCTLSLFYYNDSEEVEVAYKLYEEVDKGATSVITNDAGVSTTISTSKPITSSDASIETETTTAISSITTVHTSAIVPSLTRNSTSSILTSLSSAVVSYSTLPALSSTSTVEPPSMTGFDIDGEAGWIIAIPKGHGPYADLKLRGSAGSEFDWEEYADTPYGSPEYSGDRKRLAMEVRDVHGNEGFALTVYGEPHSLTTVQTIVATLTLDIEYDGSSVGLRKRAAASTAAFTLKGTATVTPVVSSAISSSTSVSSSSSSAAGSTSGLLAVVTTVLPSTTVVTLTSCSDGKCSETAVTTGLTTITEVDTVYTTYCPLTADVTTKIYTPIVLTTTVTASPEGTTTLTITSCSDGGCTSFAVTTGLAKTTDIVDGTATVYKTYCPLSDETLTTTVFVTSTEISSSATTSFEPVTDITSTAYKTITLSSSTLNAVPSVAPVSTFAGLAPLVEPLLSSLFGPLVLVAAFFF